MLSDKEVRYLKDNDWTDEYLPQVTEEDDETVADVQRNIGYFISYENLFSTWIAQGTDFTADNVTVALSASGSIKSIMGFEKITMQGARTAPSIIYMKVPERAPFFTLSNFPAP